jgi:hypothetical protein
VACGFSCSKCSWCSWWTYHCCCRWMNKWLGFGSEKVIYGALLHPWSTAPACHFGDSLMMCECVVPHAHSVTGCWACTPDVCAACVYVCTKSCEPGLVWISSAELWYYPPL